MVPRLEDLSGFQVVIFHALYYSSKAEKEDVKFLAADPMSLSSTPECVKIQSTWYESFEKRVANSLLEFPPGLRDKIPRSIVILFIRDIIRWIQFHIRRFDLSSEFCFRFLKLGSFFTPKGINKELAARELINNTELSIHVRFCLACHYCFYKDINVLWRQIPDSEKPRFNENKLYCDLKIYRSELVCHWCYHLLKQKQDDDIFPKIKFWGYFDLSSEVSLKNWWRKLSTNQRSRVIKCSADIFSEDCLGQSFSIDVLVYSDHLDAVKCLLFDVNNEDFDYYDDNWYLLLYHFLNWPYQEYFLMTLKSLPYVWEKLRKKRFYMLLHRIVVLMRHQFSCRLCDYRSIFIEFWKLSPRSFKRAVFDHESSDFSIFYDDRYWDTVCGYEELKSKKLLLISELFNTETYSEDDLYIIQLLLESSTKEEKSGIVKLQGEFICVKVISVGDLRIADLFIECCLPKENSASYKRTLVHFPKARLALWKFILVSNITLFEKIVNWALNSDEEIKTFKENFILDPVEVHAYTTDEMKCIDRYLEWVFAPDEIKDTKCNFASDLTIVVEEFKPFLLKGNFKKINNFLQWSFSSENEILRYKKDLASKVICNEDCFDPRKGLGEINRLIKWCALSQEERKDLKHQFAFKYFVCKAYSDILLEFKYNRIDTFIRWSELSEKRVKQFKKLLVRYSSHSHALINEYLAKGKDELIDRFLSWTQLSSSDVKKFKEKLGTKLYLEKYFFDFKLKFEDIERVFNYIQLPEKKVKIIKKNFALKSNGIIRCIEEMKWNEVDEFVNWCFTSREDCNSFKNSVFSSKGRGITWEFIFGGRFNDVDVFLNWVEIHKFEKENFLKKILYNDNCFQIIGEVLANSVKEFEGILDIMSGWESLTEEWKESFLAFLRKSAKKKTCSNCKFHLEVSCPGCSKLKLFSKDIMEFNKIVSKHMKREEKKVTNSKRNVSEIYAKSELRKSKRIKFKI